MSVRGSNGGGNAEGFTKIITNISAYLTRYAETYGQDAVCLNMITELVDKFDMPVGGAFAISLIDRGVIFNEDEEFEDEDYCDIFESMHPNIEEYCDNPVGLGEDGFIFTVLVSEFPVDNEWVKPSLKRFDKDESRRAILVDTASSKFFELVEGDRVTVGSTKWEYQLPFYANETLKLD